jgi:hypothetical protein
MSSKTPKRDHSQTILSIRITFSESVRFWKVMDKVKARSPYTSKSAIVRELVGLEPPGHLSPAELEYIRTGKPLRPKAKQ